MAFLGVTGLSSQACQLAVRLWRRDLVFSNMTERDVFRVVGLRRPGSYSERPNRCTLQRCAVYASLHICHASVVRTPADGFSAR